MNVDTVQEGSKILVLDDCGLLDSSTGLRYFFEVNSVESKVVLLLFFLGNDDSFRGVNSLVHLETQKVLDFDGLSL